VSCWLVQNTDVETGLESTVSCWLVQNTDGEEETELSVYCVTCGHEINQRSALKHMEKCFAKVCYDFIFIAFVSHI